MILGTSTSGSAWTESEEITPPEDGSELLRECAGGCRKKILIFTFSTPEDWGEEIEGALCLECKTRLIASGSLK